MYGDSDGLLLPIFRVLYYETLMRTVREIGTAHTVSRIGL